MNFTAQYVGYAVVSVTPNTAPNSGWYIEAGNFEGSGCQGYSGTGSGSSGVTLQELILYSGYPCHWEYYSFSGYLNVPVLPGTASFYFGNTNSGSATDAFTVTYYYR
ncbi:MAG TPA: hypothetical protein VNE86_04165 [Nitrososphaerales archaeon]|nr:hypothetical protein [Nitrososphaerales archaeon]